MIIRKRTSVVVPGTTWRVCASVDFVFRRYKEAAAGRRADAEQATSVAAHKDKTKKEILFYGSYTTYSMVLTPSGFLHPPILWFLHQHIHTLNRHHEATWGKTTLTFFLRLRIHLFSSHISTLDRKHNSHNHNVLMQKVQQTICLRSLRLIQTKRRVLLLHTYSSHVCCFATSSQLGYSA